MRKILLFVLIFFTLLASEVKAQEFRDDYNVVYTVNQDGQNIETHVNFSVKITNLLSDLYVKKFALTFPKSFAISNLRASDDNGPIESAISQDSDTTSVKVEFSNPKTGSGSTNTFNLTFNQDNLFKVNGNVWEVILPTIEGNRIGNYQVQIHLPKDSTRKISIAKPKPDLIQDNTIFWTNPTSRTIYAVFGDIQLYHLDLRYNLQNPKLSRVYTDIAFPPDMLHQKIYVSSITPQPDTTYTDEDGNFMGRYYLNPKQNKVVSFRGTVAISVADRPELQNLSRKIITSQKNHLLSQTSYWKVEQVDQYANLETPADIYNFITTTFNYDYERVNKNIKRLGALEALKNPSKAVCTEFSDAFVALAREKGIFSREIQGYGFSGDSQLRPLSLVTDVLHSWPEYYDQQKNLWITVDPTWQNTSGIDYFNSLDLDHIAFAIHGRRADYPLPAGMYKLEDSKDVVVSASSALPAENAKLVIEKLDIKQSLDEGQTAEGSITVKNQGNVFQYAVPITIKVRNLVVSPENFIIESIAPFEEKTFEFSYKVSGPARISGSELKIESDGIQLYAQTINARPFYYSLMLKLILFSFVCGTIFLLLKFYKKLRIRRYVEEI